MKTRWIQLEEVDSTNSFLMAHKAEYEEDLVVVTATHQTAGRGQGGNRWYDQPGDSLLFSMLVHPLAVPVARQYLLSMAEALAVRAALGNYVEELQLKWPNDIYWHDRKLSGTLIETAVGREGLRDVIFGTGININQAQFAVDAPNPVSLYQIIGHRTDPYEVLQAILTAFPIYYNKVLTGAAHEVIADYHAALYRREGFHRYQDATGVFEARLVQVKPDGRLELCDRQGHYRLYGFKEVSYILPTADPSGPLSAK